MFHHDDNDKCMTPTQPKIFWTLFSRLGQTAHWKRCAVPVAVDAWESRLEVLCCHRVVSAESFSSGAEPLDPAGRGDLLTFRSAAPASKLCNVKVTPNAQEKNNFFRPIPLFPHFDLE